MTESIANISNVLNISEEKIQAVAREVFRRLTLPRVGFVCDEPVSLPESDAFSGVLYPRKDEAGNGSRGARVYPLPGLARPENEGATLRLLVTLGCPLTVVGELLDGVPRSSEGALILGCLGRGVPVLLEGSLSAWAWYGGTACGQHLARRLERLRSWGLHFLNGAPEGALNAAPESVANNVNIKSVNANARTNANAKILDVNLSDGKKKGKQTLVLSEPGWVTWSELNSPTLRNFSVVQLRRGVKLTLEARDQLIRQDIKIQEE